MLISLQIVVWIMIGIFATIPLILYAHRLDFNHASQLLGRCLVAAAVVYLVFAVIWSDISWMGIEVAGLLFFSIFYFATSKRIMLWVGAGWVLHILWDLAHHFGPGAAFTPQWYVFVCAGFDFVIFTYCMYRWHHDQNVIMERSYSRYESARRDRKL